MNITVTTTALMAGSILSALTLTLVPTAPCLPGAGRSQATAASAPGPHPARLTEVALEARMEAATEADLGRAMGEATTRVVGPASVQAWALAPMADMASACRPGSAPSWT